MPDNESTNSDEKTEQNLSPPEGPQTQDLGNSPPESSVASGAETTPEPEKRDTLPPAETHGWLEQFEVFGWEAFQKLKAVADAGLVEAETEALTLLAAKLIVLALPHDPDALERTVNQVKALAAQTA